MKLMKDLSNYLYEKFKEVLETYDPDFYIESSKIYLEENIYTDKDNDYNYRLHFELNQDPNNLKLKTKQFLDEECFDFTNYINDHLMECDLCYENEYYDDDGNLIYNIDSLPLEISEDSNKSSNHSSTKTHTIFIDFENDYLNKSNTILDIDLEENNSLDPESQNVGRIKTNQYLELIANECNADLGYLKYDIKFDYSLDRFSDPLKDCKRLECICKTEFETTHQSIVFHLVENVITIKYFNECNYRYPQSTNFNEQIKDLNIDLNVMIMNRNPLDYLEGFEPVISHFIPIENQTLDLGKVIQNHFKKFIDWDYQNIYGRSHLVFKLNAGRIGRIQINDNNSKFNFYNEETGELIMSIASRELVNIDDQSLLLFAESVNQLIDYHQSAVI